MPPRLTMAFSLGLIALVAVAGCGSSSTTSSSSMGGGSTAGGEGGAMKSVNVSSDSKLGSILVESQGRTLYLFQKDKGGKPSCYEGCAKIWPPATVSGAPKAGTGASASKLGTVKRSDGSTQITYAGHPLYTYTLDTAAGQVHGNGVNSFGGVWNAVQPSGMNAPPGTSSGAGGSAPSGGEESTGGGSSGGGGYGY